MTDSGYWKDAQRKMAEGGGYDAGVIDSLAEDGFITVRPLRGGKTTETAQAVAERCGLSMETCRELLQRGWTYVEESGQPSRWQSRLANMTNRR